MYLAQCGVKGPKEIIDEQCSRVWDIYAEKTLDYCSCMSDYTYTTANGTKLSSQGGCIQDDPNVPPWCLVVEKSCSQPPPKKPDGQAWDICRGGLACPSTHMCSALNHAAAQGIATPLNRAGDVCSWLNEQYTLSPSEARTLRSWEVPNSEPSGAGARLSCILLSCSV